jgi:hypothetical protein
MAKNRHMAQYIWSMAQPVYHYVLVQGHTRQAGAKQRSMAQANKVCAVWGKGQPIMAQCDIMVQHEPVWRNV